MNSELNRRDIESFSEVDEVTGCWNWSGNMSSSTGYGQYTINYKNLSPHRLSYEAFYGKILNNMCVLHSCDNRACVNPEHLFLGTKGRNNQDRSNKGRSCVGEKHPLHKLTEEEVIEIRNSVLSSRKTAKVYNVSPTLIKNIRNKITWRHI